MNIILSYQFHTVDILPKNQCHVTIEWHIAVNIKAFKIIEWLILHEECIRIRDNLIDQLELELVHSPIWIFLYKNGYLLV